MASVGSVGRLAGGMGSQPLVGAVDTHVHTAPDVVVRAVDDRELVVAAAGAGMRAVVLKNHFQCTAARARLVGVVEPGLAVIGCLVLNGACGGLNVEAVRVTLDLGGRVISMPTVSATNHLEYVHRSRSNLGGLGQYAGRPVAVVRGDGSLEDAVLPIFDLIAASDAVLATGHLSWQEAAEAIGRGVTRVVVTHPESPIVDMPAATQRSLARLGVQFERCYRCLLEGWSAAALLSRIREVGVDSTILATDMGQASAGNPVDAYADFAATLLRAGLSDEEWQRASGGNATSLLKL